MAPVGEENDAIFSNIEDTEENDDNLWCVVPLIFNYLLFSCSFSSILAVKFKIFNVSTGTCLFKVDHSKQKINWESVIHYGLIYDADKRIFRHG